MKRPIVSPWVGTLVSVSAFGALVAAMLSPAQIMMSKLSAW
ncbi:MAG TPA: hypothetical protein VID48_12785 [Solirubrobacteraceae bacterium]|jgi:hypothetical protein